MTKAEFLALPKDHQNRIRRILDQMDWPVNHSTLAAITPIGEGERVMYGHNYTHAICDTCAVPMHSHNRGRSTKHPFRWPPETENL